MKIPSNQLKENIIKIVALTIIIVSIIVMLGWILGIEVLKSISPSLISMKFDTAVSFLLSGVMLYFISRSIAGEPDKSSIIIPITSLIILLMMGTMLFSMFFGIRSGAEDLFIKETTASPNTVAPGRPSIPTMANFILVALAGILTVLNIARLREKLKLIGQIIAAIGGLAIVGYIFNVSALYYFMPGINSAMALHTAGLFVLIGVGLICL